MEVLKGQGCRLAHPEGEGGLPDALSGIEQETFLILPHPQVLGYMRKKTEDYSRWIGGMAKLQRALNQSKR